MRIFSLSCLLAISGLAMPAETCAQQGRDSLSPDPMLAPLVVSYQSAFEPASRLAYGALYEGYPFSFRSGNPFFLSALPLSGSLHYFGVNYHQIALSLDLVQDLLLFSGPNGQIILSREAVTDFRIGQHFFSKLVIPADRPAGGDPTYYEVLEQGRVSLFKKLRKKIVSETTVQEGTQRLVIADSAYFVKIDNHYYPVQGIRDLSGILRQNGLALPDNMPRKSGRNNLENQLLLFLHPFNLHAN